MKTKQIDFIIYIHTHTHTHTHTHIYIYIYIYTYTHRTFYSSSKMHILSKCTRNIVQGKSVLGHKKSLNKFKRTDII